MLDWSRLYHSVLWRDLKRGKLIKKKIGSRAELTTSCSRLTSRDLMKTGEASRAERTRMVGRQTPAQRDLTWKYFTIILFSSLLLS